MKKLISIIEDIVKYGLNPNLEIEEKKEDLEKCLVQFYACSFNIEYIFDENDYEDFDKSTFPEIRENVRSNFPDFDFYHSVLNNSKIFEKLEIGTGDANDDLSEIIYDLLEIKWRNENNSESDALWFFELIFRSHTQQHLIDLLNFMKNKN